MRCFSPRVADKEGRKEGRNGNSKVLCSTFFFYGIVNIAYLGLLVLTELEFTLFAQDSEKMELREKE